MTSIYQGNTGHKFLNLPSRTLGVYNLWDSWVTAGLVKPLMTEMKEHGQWDYYLTDIEPLQRAVLNMQRRGFPLNKPAKTAYRRKVRGELGHTDHLIRQLARAEGFSFTDKFPNSSQQVGHLLFTHLELRGGKKTPAGKHWSADQEALNRALKQLRKRDENHRRLLHALFHRSRLETIDTRYLDMAADDDGRVRATVKMLHAKTLRYAYEKPPLQQFPPEARHIFVASPGHRLVAADYAQLEARLLAYSSKDKVSIEAFESGQDIHAVNARDLFGWSDEAWDGMDPTRRKAARIYAKSGFLYRKVYGGTAATSDKKLSCPCVEWGCADKLPPTAELKKSDAVAAENRWMNKHPAVQKFQREMAKQVRQTHYYSPPLGGRRWIAKPWGSDLERELANIPWQTTAAQIMIRAQTRLDELGVPIVLQMHDSFVADVPEGDTQATAYAMKSTMEAEVPELGTSFPVDITIGKNWGDYHKDDNPEGLREWQMRKTC